MPFYTLLFGTGVQQSPYHEHVVDDLEVLNDIVRRVDEEASDDTVECILMLGCRVHLVEQYKVSQNLCY